MNYVDFTQNLISDIKKENKESEICVLGAGFGGEFDQPREEQDILNYCEEVRNEGIFYDHVIMSRVLEHLPVRNVDWYLYNIATMMKPNATLHVIVPDMAASAKQLELEFKKDKPDYFKTNRLTYELFSEGNAVWWRHSLWTDINSTPYYLTLENLFRIMSVDRIRLDTDMVPEELYFKAQRN